jgi:outer membrane protein
MLKGEIMARLAKSGIVIAMALFLSSPLQAQIFKKGIKIGYIDIAKAFDEYKRTDIATEELKKVIEEKKTDIEKRKPAITLLKQKLDTQGVVINEQEKSKMEGEVESKISELKDMAEKSNKELRQKEDALVRSILNDIKEAVKSYGKENSFDLILDSREVHYAPDGMDITDEIVKIINSKLKK